MAVANPMMVVTLDPTKYTAMLNKTAPDEAPAVAAARRDPMIEFDDAARTVKVGYEYRVFVEKHTPFRKFIDIWQVRDGMRYATPAFKALLDGRRNGARDALRGAFDPQSFVEPRTPKIDPAASGKSAADGLLAIDGGFVVGRSHKDSASAKLLGDILNTDGKPVDMFFIEEFPIELQGEVDAYMAAPSGAALGPNLQKRVAELKSNYAVDWEPMLAKAKEKKVKLYGIDSPTADPGVEDKDPQYGERRVAIMNKLALDVIKKAQADNPGGKFVVMTGEAHLNTHAGGVPGLAQSLQVPAMRVNEQGKLRAVPDDKSLRTMPRAAEQAFIDAAMDTAIAAYAAVKTDGDTAELDQGHMRRALSALAASFTARGNLLTANSVPALLTHAKTTAVIDDMCKQTKQRQTRRTGLLKAIDDGNVASVKKLIAEDPDCVHQAGAQQRTLLHEAAKAGKADVVDVLLAAGANPNVLDEAYASPLHEACRAGGDTAGTSRMVTSMIGRGGDLSQPDGDAKSAYDHVLDRKDPALLGTLVDAGQGNLEDLFLLSFEQKAQVAYDRVGRDPALHNAFDAGELRALAKQRFAKVIADVPLASADDVTNVLQIDNESTKAITALIGRTKKRKQNRIDMLSAIDADDADNAASIMTEDPLFKTLDISEGKTALDMAAVAHKTTTMIKLIGAGADPKAINARGRTPLMEVCDKDISKTDDAAKREVHETAGILLDIGADPNQTDRQGRTALHFAGFHDNGDVVKELATNGADPTIQDSRGWTALDMTLGSTNKATEKAFYDNGLAKVTPRVPPGGHSTIDLLCMATRNDSPNLSQFDRAAAELKTRKMYEQLYAMEPLRPILDLAAASTCNDRDPPNGGARIFTTDSVTVNLLYGKDNGPAGAYDEKVNSVLVGMTPKDGRKEDVAGGKLIHELTHMTTHLVTGSDETVPYKPGDAKGKQAYLDAIDADLKRMHLLCDGDPGPKEPPGGDPAHSWVKDRLVGRMPDYGQKIGETGYGGTDKRLLQEHIVTAPQLMAAFGPDYVREKLPNLTAQFEKLSQEAAETLKTDPRFAKGRAAIDPAKNAALIQRLIAENVAPKAPPAKMLSRNGKDFTVETMMKKIRADYVANHGRAKAPDPSRPTIRSTPDDFEMDPAAADMANRRFAQMEKILKVTMTTDRMPMELSSEALAGLVTQLSAAVHGAADDKALLKTAAMVSDTWVKKSHVELAKSRAAANLGLSPTTLANAVVCESELLARKGGSADDKWIAAALDAKQSKHKAAVAALKSELEKDENAEAMKKPDILLKVLPRAVTDPTSGAIKVKTKKRRVGKARDPQHVSIDVKSARRQWMQALGNKSLT